MNFGLVLRPDVFNVSTLHQGNSPFAVSRSGRLPRIVLRLHVLGAFRCNTKSTYEVRSTRRKVHRTRLSSLASPSHRSCLLTMACFLLLWMFPLISSLHDIMASPTHLPTTLPLPSAPYPSSTRSVKRLKFVYH